MMTCKDLLKWFGYRVKQVSYLVNLSKSHVANIKILMEKVVAMVSIWQTTMLLLSLTDRLFWCYCHQLTDCFGAIVINWQTVLVLLSSADRLFWYYGHQLTDHYVAIVIQWQTFMMLRLKLNDQLVDIASEGLLRPKLYDEKEIFYFTIVKNSWK